MISLLYLAREPVILSVADFFAPFEEVARQSGGAPDLVVVGDTGMVPVSPQHYDFVPVSRYGTLASAFRSGLQRCTGGTTICFDSRDQVTLDTYQKLIGPVTYPIPCGASTLAREPWRLLDKSEALFGAREYGGPLRFPFAVRTKARLEVGGLPATVSGGIDEMLTAYSVVLRSNGWKVVGCP